MALPIFAIDTGDATLEDQPQELPSPSDVMAGFKPPPFQSVNQPSMFSSGLGNLVPPSENPDWAMTQAMARDPMGAVKSIPDVALAPFSAAGKMLGAAVADVGTSLSGHPEYGGNLSDFFNRTSPQESAQPTPQQETLAQVSKTNPVIATAAKVAQGLVETAPMIAASVEGLAGKLIALGFSADMISKAPQLARDLGEELGKPVEQRDQDRLTTLVADAIQTGVFAPLAGAHGLRDVPGQFSSAFDTANRTLPRPPTTGEPNASSFEKTATIHGDLQPQPIQGQREMPAAESGGGIQPRKEPASPINVPENVDTKGSSQEVTGQNHAQDLGYRWEGQADHQTGKPVWNFGIQEEGPAKGASFSIEAGATPEQIKAKANEFKARFEEGAAAPISHPDEVGALNGEQFFDLSSELSKKAMADKTGKTLGLQRIAENVADQHPDLKLWERGLAETEAEKAKFKAETGGDPAKMMARMKEMQGLGQKGQFFSEGIKQIKFKEGTGEKPASTPTAAAPKIEAPIVNPEKIDSKLIVDPAKSAETAAKFEPVNNDPTVSSIALDPATGNPLSASDALVNKLETPSPKPSPRGLTGEVGKMIQREGNRVGDRTAPLPAPPAGEPVTHDLGSGEPVAAAGPGVVGMGAATPEDFKVPPSTPTGIKNATVDLEREKRGLPPAMEPARRSFGKVWDEATSKIDRDPQAQDDLIKELHDKPRALTDTEDAMLLHRQIDLQNEHAKAGRDMLQAQEDGRPESVQEEKLRLARISDQLLELYNINKTSGTETGRGLNARKMMANEDFSLAAMETKMRAAKDGAPLTDAEKVEISKKQKKIEATQKAVDEHAATADKTSVSKSTDAAMKDVAKEAPTEARSKDFDIDREDKLAAGIKAKIDKGQLNEITPLVQQLARVLWRRGVRGREPMIDGLHDILKTIVPDFTRDQTQRAFSGYGDFTPLSKEAIDIGLRDLRGQTQQVLKLEALEARKPLEKTGQERRVPSDEERRLIKQVNELKRKYGVVVTDPATQLRSALQSRKTYYEHRISDLKHEIETRERIVKTKSPSPTDPDLEKMKAEYETLKKEHGEIFQKPGLTDTQRLDMAVKSADRQIVELERQLKSGEIFPKGKIESKLTSAELEARRARIDALKEERDWARDLVQPKPEIDPNASGLKALKTRLKNRTAELLEKTAANDFTKMPRRTVELDPEAIRLKAANENAKLEFDRAAMRERLKNRTPFEKVQDTFTKWRRAFLLSSPVTLAKLTSAAVERMAFTPTEELVGGAYSKLPIISRVARQAPREGGMNVAAESRAITEGFTKGMKDAETTLRTGHSDLDSLFGRRDVMPREVIDMIGSMHGALKAPVKRAEFARSFEKRTAFAIKNGLDASDPMVQTKIAMEAYKDANRSIFMQDNAVVSAFSRAMSALEQRDKATGQTPPGRKAIATAAKFVLPIVKVPTNIIAETITHVTGLPTGMARIVNAMRKGGLDNLPPEHADLIMRELKKGSLGGALLLAGYFTPQLFGGYYQPNDKKQTGHPKFGTMQIGGVNVPTFLIHNPLLETLQIGATIRHVADSKLHKKDAETQGVGAGVLSAALGLTEEVPFVRNTTDMLRIMNPYERQKYFNQIVKDSVVPLGVSWVAQHFDKDAQGNYIPRDPKTIMQSIESGIPGLRQKVPAKGSSIRDWAK